MAASLFQPHVLSYLTGIVGGPFLIAYAFSKSYRSCPALLRTTLWFSGSLAICWGLLGLAYWHGYNHFAPGVQKRLFQWKGTCGGGSLALLIMLITSREFWKASLASWPGHHRLTTRPLAKPSHEL